MDLNEFGWEASKCFHGNGWVLPRGNFTEALLWNFFSAHRSPSPDFLTWTNYYKILCGGKKCFLKPGCVYEILHAAARCSNLSWCSWGVVLGNLHGQALEVSNRVREAMWVPSLRVHTNSTNLDSISVAYFSLSLRGRSNLGTCSPISPQAISYWFNPYKCWDLVTVGNPTYPQFLMVQPPLPILFSISLFHPNLNEENPQQFTLNITHVCSSYKNRLHPIYSDIISPIITMFHALKPPLQQVQPVLGHLGRLGCHEFFAGDGDDHPAVQHTTFTRPGND